MADKKDDLISALRDLKETVGWKIIEKVLDENIKEVDEILRGNTDLITDLETLKALQQKRSDRLALRNIVDGLIKEYADKEAFPVELDPYS